MFSNFPRFLYDNVTRCHKAGTFVDEKGTLYEGEWRHGGCPRRPLPSTNQTQMTPSDRPLGKFHGVGKHICRGETYTGAFEVRNPAL